MYREFFIAKKPAEKNAFRFNGIDSLNKFLQRRNDLDQYITKNLPKAFHQDGDSWHVDCLEYEQGESLHKGDIVAFEKVGESKNTPVGINCWILGKNAKINIVVDDSGQEVIYSKSTPVYAIEYSDNDSLERFVKNHSTGDYFNENITLNDNGAIIKTSWGESQAEFGSSLCVCYGINDFNFLNKNTESYSQYYECDENGNTI